MDMDSAAVFLSASILIGLGVIAIGIAIIVLNNLFAKYWKPVEWAFIPEALRIPPSRFVEPHELEKITPTMGDNHDPMAKK
jgi:hypothetical protein